MRDPRDIATIIADIPAHLGYYPSEDILCVRHDGTRTLGAARIGIDALVGGDVEYEQLREWYECFTAASSGDQYYDPRWSLIAVTRLHPATIGQFDYALRILDDWLPEIPSPGYVPVVTPKIEDGAPVFLYDTQGRIPDTPIAHIPPIAATASFQNLMRNTGQLPMLTNEELYAQCTSRDHGFDDADYALLVQDVTHHAAAEMIGSNKALAATARGILERGNTHSIDTHDVAILLEAIDDFPTRNALLETICEREDDNTVTDTAACALSVLLRANSAVPEGMHYLQAHTAAMLAVAACACNHHGLASAAINTAVKHSQHAQHCDDDTHLNITPYTDTDTEWISRLHTAMTYGDHRVTLRALAAEGRRAFGVLS